MFISKSFSLFYTWGVIAILALVAIIFDPWFTPIGFGKTIIFRIIFSLLFLVFLLQIVYRNIKIIQLGEKIKSISPVFWLLVASLGIFLISTLFSLNRTMSLWGSPSRSGGYINFLFYALLAILTFLTLKKNNWQRIFDFAAIMGILVCLMALIQQFGLFPKYFITFDYRPVSFLGNPIFVAIYLLLLSFSSLFSAIESKNIYRKVFHFLCIAFFILIIVLVTQTRAAFIGLAIGALWFIFAYPFKNISGKKIKLYLLFALLVLVFLSYNLKKYMDGHAYIYSHMPPLVATSLDRALGIFDGTNMFESRISTWTVALSAVKDRPILGYGLENFSIGFDKFYDPKLPELGASGTEQATQWWDRAHNILFDFATSYGIPALIIYLSFFGALLWQLQKVKNKKPELAITANCLQAGFISYFIAELFSFDNFDIYIILFLLIGYSFYLISEANNSKISQNTSWKLEKIGNYLYRQKTLIGIVLGIITILFIYVYNARPLSINKELNTAFLLQNSSQTCPKILKILDEVNSSSSNIIDNYIRNTSVEMIQTCSDEETNPETKVALVENEKKLLQKNAISSPNYTANWLLLGEINSILIEKKIDTNENFLKSSEMLALKNEATDYFKKAAELSPKRQETYKDLAKMGIDTEDYALSVNSAQKCIDLNSNDGDCYWLAALTQGYLKNENQFSAFFNLATQNGYDPNSEGGLRQLANMYIKTNDYKNLVLIYEKLVNNSQNKEQKAQLLASLAAAYSDMGDKKMARTTALRILEIMPDAKAMVDEFLKTLK